MQGGSCECIDCDALWARLARRPRKLPVCFAEDESAGDKEDIRFSHHFRILGILEKGVFTFKFFYFIQVVCLLTLFLGSI
jgi:hypothetical protein